MLFYLLEKDEMGGGIVKLWSVVMDQVRIKKDFLLASTF